eukprot:686189-Prymnesium_polylepis.1
MASADDPVAALAAMVSRARPRRRRDPLVKHHGWRHANSSWCAYPSGYWRSGAPAGCVDTIEPFLPPASAATLRSGLAAAWVARGSGGASFALCTNCAHDAPCGSTKYCRHRDGDSDARAWAAENRRRGAFAFARYELAASHPLHAAAGDALRAASVARVAAVLGGRRVKGVRQWTVTALGPCDFVGVHIDDGRHGD